MKVLDNPTIMEFPTCLACRTILIFTTIASNMGHGSLTTISVVRIGLKTISVNNY